MAYLVRAEERRDEILSALDQHLRERDAWAEREARAAQTVQTRFRCSSSQRKFLEKRARATMLQRIYRGYEGRKCATEREREVEQQRQQLLFDYFAEIVQRLFRGYYSRKVKHDFHARKKYIADMVSKSHEQQERLNKLAAEAQAKEVERRNQIRAQKIKETTTGLHYLLSTKAQRGIMNVPGRPSPTIDGKPVEAVISNNVKEYLKAHKLDVRKPVVNKPIIMKGTVRTSSPFDVADERIRQEKKWSKLRRVGNKDFIAGTKPRQPQYRRGLNEGSKYIEPRTIGKSTKEILASQKHKFVSKKPFLMAVKTGQLFDES